jgi:hypothetical protein
VVNRHQLHAGQQLGWNLTGPDLLTDLPNVDSSVTQGQPPKPAPNLARMGSMSRLSHRFSAWPHATNESLSSKVR